MPSCSHPADRAEPLFPARDYVSGESFEVRRCAACGLALTWPPPPPEQLGRYYPATYYGTPGRPRFPSLVERVQAGLYGRRARAVEASAGGRAGRVLDVGCGKGFLLDAFRRRGWSAEGIELSEQSARNAREVLGLEVHVGAVEALGLPAGRYDAVVMWHVLEHVTDPAATLAEVHRLLRPGGAFLVSVPNFGSPEARATRDGWFHLDVPRHLVHFTPESLRRALRAAGFAETSVSWSAPEFDLFSFVQSSLNRLGLRQNLLYDLLRRQGSRLKQVSWGEAVLSVALAVPLTLVGLLATGLATLTARGSTMTLLVRRPG